MISGLIDELRKSADGQATFHDAREVMLEAADTIWQLRDDLQRANAENTKLREIIVTLVFCANDEADCDQCPMNGIHCDEVQSCFCDEMADELCKLGMEVKECMT